MGALLGAETAMNVVGAPAFTGGVPAAAVGSAAARFTPVRGPIKSEADYIYHATNSDRAREIAELGKLKTHKPHEFTDQSVWPDGSTQKRNYFTGTADNTWQFAPEDGTPVLLRMRADPKIGREKGTGDLYTTKPISADRLEAYTNEGWIPLKNKGDPILGSNFADKRFAMGALAANNADPLWSPISTQKLRKPLSEMEHGFTDVRTPVPKFVRPEDMVGGILVPTPSDLSRGNRTLTHVDTQKLDRPVEARGGVSFPEANPGQLWASEQAIASRLRNQAERLAQTGKKVYVAPMTMSPRAIDASHHVADPLAQMVKTAPIKRDDVKAFNDLMRQDVPDWVSIKSPKFDQYINSLEGGMTIKALMAKRMAMERWQSKGFPNVAAVRHAMSEPALIDQPRYTTGMAISQYTPGKGLLESGHPSYSKGVAGEHMGQLASLLPFEVAYRDIAKGLAARNAENLAAGKKQMISPRYHLEKPTPGVPTHQELTPEWLEGVMKRLEQNKARGR